MSHLPPYFPEPHKDALLSAPSVLSSSLFSEQDIKNLLDVSHTCASLKSQQAMVDVVKNQGGSRTPPQVS